MLIRAPVQADLADWLLLWEGYNRFYGRHGPSALPENVTRTTWSRILDPKENVNALVAGDQGKLMGLAHYLFHKSTTRVEEVCYLSDLFVLPTTRGQGVGKALLLAVYDKARSAGSTRVYWQTRTDNASARKLYDRLAKHDSFIVYAAEPETAMAATHAGSGKRVMSGPEADGASSFTFPEG